MIQPTLLLGLPAHLRLDQIEITSQTLILSLAVETAEAACPLCQQVSHRIHSHYTRPLADLPCGGKVLRLLVVVRRFFCTNGGMCSQDFRLADRFQVLRNLAETAEKILGQHRQALKSIHLITTPAATSPLLRHLRPERQQRKQRARAKLVERYEAVHRLVKQGFSHREISRQLHLHRESVIRSARAETFPERAEQPARPGILAPYEKYLRARWIAGERNAVSVFREVTARGYTGSRMTIERFLLGLRRMEQQGMEVSQAATSVELTPRRAVGLRLRPGIDLTEGERMALRQVCQIHPPVKRLNALFQQFAQMLRDRRGKSWINGSILLSMRVFRSYELLSKNCVRINRQSKLDWFSNGTTITLHNAPHHSDEYQFDSADRGWSS